MYLILEIFYYIYIYISNFLFIIKKTLKNNRMFTIFFLINPRQIFIPPLLNLPVEYCGKWSKQAKMLWLYLRKHKCYNYDIKSYIMFQYSHYDPTCWLNLALDMTFLESFPLYIYIYIYIHLPSKQWKTYFGLFIRNVKVSFDKKKTLRVNWFFAPSKMHCIW
jgi:hypothetical protein